MRRTSSSLRGLIVGLIVGLVAVSTAAEPFRPADRARLPRLVDASVSRSGAGIAYVLAWGEGEGERYELRVRGRSEALVSTIDRLVSPRWLDESTLAFLRLRGGGGAGRVWTVSVDGASGAREVPGPPAEVASFAVVRDGLVLAAVDEPRLELWSRDDGAPVPVALPEGAGPVVPVRPWHGTMAVDPSGRGLVVVVAEGRALASLSLDGKAPWSELLPVGGREVVAGPVFSGSGESLSILAAAGEAGPVLLSGPWPDGPLVEQGIGRSGTPVWIGGGAGDELLLAVDARGDRGLVGWQAGDTAWRELVSDGSVRWAASLADGAVLVARETLGQPLELLDLDPATRVTTPVTPEIRAAIEPYDLGVSEHLAVRRSEGPMASVRLVRPAVVRGDSRIPLVVALSDRDGTFGNRFDLGLPVQELAARGVAVLLAEPDDPQLLERAVAAAVLLHPWLDPLRVCALAAHPMKDLEALVPERAAGCVVARGSEASTAPGRLEVVMALPGTERGSRALLDREIVEWLSDELEP